MQMDQDIVRVECSLWLFLKDDRKDTIGIGVEIFGNVIFDISATFNFALVNNDSNNLSLYEGKSTFFDSNRLVL